MLKRLGADDESRRQAIVNDLKRVVHINDEKNQLLIHMACQKVLFGVFRLDFFFIFRRKERLQLLPDNCKK